MKDEQKLQGSLNDATLVTVDQLKDLLPKRTSANVTDEIVDLVNNMGSNVDLPQELLQDDFLSYMHLIGSVPGIGMKDLVNATKFCNLKRNYTNIQSYSLTFPEKYLQLKAAGKQIDNFVSMYNTTKLVQAIDKEMLIPAHLQYAPYFHAAVKKQFQLMNGNAGHAADGEPMTVSPMVMHLAAKELALITKQPEESKIDITINQGAEARQLQMDMNDQLRKIAASQKRRLDEGEDIIDVQQIGVSIDTLRGEGNA